MLPQEIQELIRILPAESQAVVNGFSIKK